MPVTPLTTECRKISARMAGFSLLCGNAQILRQLIYQDSATVFALKDAIIGTNPAEADALILVGATCGSCGEGVGNIKLHAPMASGVAPLNAAIAVAEAAADSPAAPPPEPAPDQSLPAA